jgi:hypothetical protein
MSGRSDYYTRGALGPCLKLADCPPDHRCVSGQCRPLISCPNPLDCRPGDECVAGFCRSACRGDGDCGGAGEYCNAGYCEFDCRVARRCPPGHVCTTGPRCTAPPRCAGYVHEHEGYMAPTTVINGTYDALDVELHVIQGPESDRRCAPNAPEAPEDEYTLTEQVPPGQSREFGTRLGRCPGPPRYKLKNKLGLVIRRKGAVIFSADAENRRSNDRIVMNLFGNFNYYNSDVVVDQYNGGKTTECATLVVRPR